LETTSEGRRADNTLLRDIPRYNQALLLWLLRLFSVVALDRDNSPVSRVTIAHLGLVTLIKGARSSDRRCRKSTNSLPNHPLASSARWLPEAVTSSARGLSA
jgi:hypothetical protein